MISVMTEWDEIDEFPAAGDVSIMAGGILVVMPELKEGEDPTKVPAIAIYADGAWKRVDRDESAIQLTSFLERNGLFSEWCRERDGE